MNTNPAWERKCAAAPSRKSCEGRALLYDFFLSPTWQNPLMDSVKVSLPSPSLVDGFFFIKYPSSSSCFSCAPSLLWAWEMGHDEGQKGEIRLASQRYRLLAKSDRYLPTPFLYLFTFSKGPLQPWIALSNHCSAQISHQCRRKRCQLLDFLRFVWETMQTCACSRHCSSLYHKLGWQWPEVMLQRLM